MSDQDSPRSDDEDRTPVSPTTQDESQGSWTLSYRAWTESEEAAEYFEAEDRSIPASEVSCSSSYREWMNSAEGSEFFLEDSPLGLKNRRRRIPRPRTPRTATRQMDPEKPRSTQNDVPCPATLIMPEGSTPKRRLPQVSQNRQRGGVTRPILTMRKTVTTSFPS